MCRSQTVLAGKNKVYNPHNSTHFKPTTIDVEIEFGSGPLEGVFGFDDFWVGGGEAEHELIHV